MLKFKFDKYGVLESFAPANHNCAGGLLGWISFSPGIFGVRCIQMPTVLRDLPNHDYVCYCYFPLSLAQRPRNRLE